MPSSDVSLRLTGLSVLTVLAVLAGLAASNVHTANTHNLPIPILDKILALALPLTQLIAVVLLACGCRTADFFSPPSSSAVRTRRQQLKAVAAFVLWLLSALDAVLLSTSAVALDNEGMDCTLERTWLKWYTHKNTEAIRSIQDRYECCGLRSIVDRAWPFPDKTHSVHACEQTYGRTQSCLAQWTTNARGVLASFTAIGAASLVLKVLAVIIFVAIQLSDRNSGFGKTSRQNDPTRRRLLEQDNRVASPVHEEIADEQPSAVWASD